ncbi:MAG: carph-isopro domain-containing protein [Hyphomicrobiaceae bacterium]
MKHDQEPRIKTVSDFVRAFGGTAALAEFLDVGPSCVSNWKRDGSIPPGWHMRLQREACRRGIDLPDALFEGPAARPFVPRSPFKRQRRRQTIAA